MNRGDYHVEIGDNNLHGSHELHEPQSIIRRNGSFDFPSSYLIEFLENLNAYDAGLISDMRSYELPGNVPFAFQLN